jgi:hypothetical protein
MGYYLDDDSVAALAVGLTEVAASCWSAVTADYKPPAPLRLLPTAKPARKRRERKPSVATLIKRAEKAGKTVTAITTAEGVTLTFGEAKTEQTNEPDPWERAMQGPKQ